MHEAGTQLLLLLKLLSAAAACSRDAEVSELYDALDNHACHQQNLVATAPLDFLFLLEL